MLDNERQTIKSEISNRPEFRRKTLILQNSDVALDYGIKA